MVGDEERDRADGFLVDEEDALGGEVDDGVSVYFIKYVCVKLCGSVGKEHIYIYTYTSHLLDYVSIFQRDFASTDQGNNLSAAAHPSVGQQAVKTKGTLLLLFVAASCRFGAAGLFFLFFILILRACWF